MGEKEGELKSFLWIVLYLQICHTVEPTQPTSKTRGFAMECA